MTQRVLKLIRVPLLALFSMVAVQLTAQDAAPPPPDSTEVVADTASAPAEPEKKAYERIKLNIDTVTHLVTYKAIIDQSETGADSFYVRAKKWADRKYNLVRNKKLVILDKPNEKLVLRVRFDAYTSVNKFNKSVVGSVVFTLTVIFKDDKYKYIIDNIVYEPFQDEELVKSGKLKPEQYDGVTYFEYLLQKKYKVKETDNLLRCADSEFSLLIADIKKALKNPVQVDEDDF